MILPKARQSGFSSQAALGFKIGGNYNGVDYETLPWSDGILPISFQGNFTQQQRDLFFTACATWGKVANVTCVPYTTEARPLLVDNTFSGSGCSATVGMLPPDVSIPWGPGNPGGFVFMTSTCWRVETIIHELGHVLGFLHEQNRPDRDQYIVVGSNPLCVTDWQYKLAGIPVTLPYDLLSVMHYPLSACATLRPQYQELFYQIGPKTFPSELDGAAMTTIYGPPATPYRRTYLHVNLRTSDPEGNLSLSINGQLRKFNVKNINLAVFENDVVDIFYGGYAYQPVRWDGNCPLGGANYVFPRLTFVATEGTDYFCDLSIGQLGEGRLTPPGGPPPIVQPPRTSPPPGTPRYNLPAPGAGKRDP